MKYRWKKDSKSEELCDSPIFGVEALVDSVDRDWPVDQ